MSNTLLRLVIPDAVAVLRRFPVAVLAAAMIAGRGLIWDADTYAEWRSEPAAAWRFAWSIVLMSAIGLGVLSESLALRRGALLQGLSFAMGAGAWLGYGAPHVSMFWTLIALSISIFAAAAPGRDEQALWSFSVRAAALLVFAVVATSIVVLGLIAVKSTTEYLFEIKLDRNWNQRIVIAGYWFVLPIYFCSLLPRRDMARLSCDDLLFKATVALGALLALVAGALGILLYAYGAKIVFDGALPKNQVGSIVSAALLVGLVGWLLAAGEGGPAASLRRVFWRWWFPATAIPAVLLSFAIWERIEAYGVTPDRYAIGVAAVVSLLLIALFTVRLEPPTIRSAFLVGAGVASFAAIGPQNMPNVVAMSQIERLESLLAAEGLLQNGRIIGGPLESWEKSKSGEIRSILGALNAVSALDRLSTIAPPERTRTYADAISFFGAAGVSPARASDATPSNPWIEFPDGRGVVALDGGLLVGPFAVVRAPDDPAGRAATDIESYRIALEARRLVVKGDKGETVFDLTPLATSADDQSKRPFSIRSVDGRSTLQVAGARLHKAEGLTALVSVRGSAFIAEP